MGETPHIAAKEASLRSRSGLSPAATNKMAATSGPTPFIARSAGLARREVVECEPELIHLVFQREVAPGQGPECASIGFGRVRQVAAHAISRASGHSLLRR